MSELVNKHITVFNYSKKMCKACSRDIVKINDRSDGFITRGKAFRDL